MFKSLMALKLKQNPLSWRLLTATTLLALAAGVAQTALAAPGGSGGPGMHGGRGHAEGAGAHAGMGGMAWSPRHVDRMLDSVNATAEQRAQVTKIVDAARADMQAQRVTSQSLHQQSQALFAQPTVDARAAETLRQQMMAQHEQASKRLMQVKLDISRVLTPEQRKTLAERMESRRSLMERHRLERQALDKPKV